MMRKLISGFALAALIAACLPTARAADDKTIAEIVAGSPDHTILLSLVKEAGLVEKLGEKGEWTVFAPNDAAFKKLDKATVEKVKGDKELLKSVLMVHAAKGTWTADKVVTLDGKEVETLGGTKFKVTVKDKNVMIGDAKVIKADLKASNGVVHVIDTVLMPAK